MRAHDVRNIGVAASSVGNVATTINVVTEYGAKGDARQASDGVANSTTTFTSASFGFVSRDAGKLFTLNHAGTGFTTTIASVTNATTIVLSAALSFSGSSIQFTVGTDNHAAITNAIAAVPLDIVTETGATIYFPAGQYLTSAGFSPARGSTTGNGGIWFKGAGSFSSRLVGACDISTAILTLAQIAGNPSGVVDLGIVGAIGGMPSGNCLNLTNSNGIFLERCWFSSGNRNVQVTATSSLWVTQTVNEVGISRNWYFTGACDGRITGNETYCQGAAGFISWDFQSVTGNATTRLILADNDDISASVNTTVQLNVNASYGIDFGQFQFKGNNPPTTAVINITGSHDISISPKIDTAASVGISVDATSHDILVSAPDFQAVTTPISVASGSYNVNVTSVAVSPNMVKGSGTFAGWSVSGFTTAAGAGPRGETALTLSGTGSPGGTLSGVGISSSVTAAQQGQVVSFGGYIDATNVTAGGVLIWSLDTNLSNGVAHCNVPNGAKGWCWTTYTLPAGVTSLRLEAGNNNATITNGALAVWSSPKVEINAFSTLYMPGDSSPISVIEGGTGDTTLTAHGVLVGEGTSPVAVTAAGASGLPLQGNGAADPTFAQIALATAISDFTTGTFTPVLSFGGGSVGITYTTQVGHYLKIGSAGKGVLVFALQIQLSAKGTSTGAALISGLPVAGAAFNQAITIGFSDGFTSTNWINSFLAASGSALNLYSHAAGVNTQLADTNFTNTSNVVISGAYLI